MVGINETIALSVSALALLSIISISILVCMAIVYWKYRTKEREKRIWYNSPSEFRTGWLTDERKCLVPGTFSAKFNQPDPVLTDDKEAVSRQLFSHFLRINSISILRIN